MVREVTKYIAEDGSEYETRQLAEAQDRFIALARQLDRDHFREPVDSDDIVKWIADNARAVREFLDFVKPAGK